MVKYTIFGAVIILYDQLMLFASKRYVGCVHSAVAILNNWVMKCTCRLLLYNPLMAFQYILEGGALC